MTEDPAWPAIYEALLMARRHANHHDIAADAVYLLTTAAEIIPYLSESNDDDNE
jgi:hypothetical protein